MTSETSGRRRLIVSELTPEAFASYGSVLEKPAGAAVAFNSAAIDFRQAHVFRTGGGEPEILWVTYRDASVQIDRLEMHNLTEQAVIPLIGEIIQIVALGSTAGTIDPDSIRAFRVPVGRGICMRPECWHTTRVIGPEATCMMLTRRSTTADLIGHLTSGQILAESAFCDVRLQLAMDDDGGR